ncbi:hypothetical protein T439DRAFT_378211 [Meredithblackwellia eburnea MCA 4105]
MAPATSSQSQLSPQKNRQPRPDKFTIGDRGRKTGVTIPQAQRDADGFEPIDHFFKASPKSTGFPTPAARKAAAAIFGNGAGSTAGLIVRKDPKSLVRPGSSRTPAGTGRGEDGDEGGSSSGRKKRTREDEDDHHQRNNSADMEDFDYNQDFGGGGDDDEEEEEDDGSGMDMNDGTSLTPSTFLRRKSTKANTSNSSKKRRVVNSDSEENDEEEDEEEIAMASASKGHKTNTKLDKGKGRAVERSPVALAADKKGKGKANVFLSPSPDRDEEEEEFGYTEQPQYEEEDEDEDEGLDAVQEEGEDDEDEEHDDEEVQERLAPKGRNGKGKDKAGKPPSSKKKNGSSNPPVSASAKSNQGQRARKKAPPREDPEGVRRSGRQKIEPLEYWRNERVIYKRRQSGLGIDAVVRIEKEPVVSLNHRRKGASGGRRQGSRATIKKRSPSAGVKSEIPEEEEGVDEMTDEDGIVWSWEGDCEVQRRIAFTSKMMNPVPTSSKKFSFQKIFTELDYLAGGIVQIPSGHAKPLKQSKDNSYLFYVIEGAVSVTTHRTIMSMGTGGTFFVPRGNFYSIQTISSRDARLFFAQARRVLEDADGEGYPDVRENYVTQEGEEEEVGDFEEE